MSSAVDIHPANHSYEMPDDAYKRGPTVTTQLSGRQYGIDGIEDDEIREVDALESNRYDQRDMQRLGKRQEMRRNYRTLSMLSFTIIVQATWEFILV